MEIRKTGTEGIGSGKDESGTQELRNELVDRLPIK
jgi:hypothetical protein